MLFVEFVKKLKIVVTRRISLSSFIGLSKLMYELLEALAWFVKFFSLCPTLGQTKPNSSLTKISKLVEASALN